MIELPVCIYRRDAKGGRFPCACPKLITKPEGVLPQTCLARPYATATPSDSPAPKPVAKHHRVTIAELRAARREPEKHPELAERFGGIHT
jgi:hypothetical protein